MTAGNDVHSRSGQRQRSCHSSSAWTFPRTRRPSRPRSDTDRGLHRSTCRPSASTWPRPIPGSGSSRWLVPACLRAIPIRARRSTNSSLDGSGIPVYKGADRWMDGSMTGSAWETHEGYLRVGTTRGGWWGEAISNQLAVLHRRSDRAPGRARRWPARLPSLAPGERIYSMRFDRDRGYMVTFKQTDPLFTLDLQDPEGPQGRRRAEGERFCNLHSPARQRGADIRLLTIGRSADSGGRVTGNKLQLFDVSDSLRQGDRRV